MKVKELIRRIERIVPPDWALPDDPIGLLVGDPERDVKRVLVGLEAATAFLRQAVRRKADFLLVHHPLIYHPLRRLLENDPVQRLVRELIRRDMALYAAHTNFDLHPEGMAKTWAVKLGCRSMHPLAPKPQGRRLKLVVFVPPEHTDKVREALAGAGAGNIGEYSRCSFSARGEGTFCGSEESNPFTGRSGVFERAEEDRLEMILPERAKWAVVNALYAAHPYEEPAYDLFELDEFRDLRQALWIGEFERALSWDEFLRRVSASLPRPEPLGGVRPKPRRRIRKIALATGGGASLISMAAGLDVDAYLTGEVGYHSLWEANELGLNVVTAGHGGSESLFAESIVPLLSRYINEVVWLTEQ